MRKMLLACLLCLSACSSPSALKYYQLPAVATQSGVDDNRAGLLYVAPVQVASYLNGRGLVLQLSDVELHMARQHLWAEPLTTQVQRQLRERLSTNTNYRVLLSPVAQAVELTVQLERFHGTADGEAVIGGRYQLSRQSASKTFNFTVPLNADGYAALTAALALGLEQLSRQIGADLAENNKTSIVDG